MADAEGPEAGLVAVDRADLDRERRRQLGQEVPAADVAALPVCTAPAALLLREADGTVRACEFTSTSLGAPGTSLAAAWAATARGALTQALTSGALPLPHCAGCAAACASGLGAQAPPARAYGSLRPGADDRMPSVLVLRLPARGSVPGLAGELSAHLPVLSRLVLEGEAPLASEAGHELLAVMRAANRRPSLELRARRFGEVAAATQALSGLTVERLVLEIGDSQGAMLADAKALAQTLGVPLRARLRVLPDSWFDLLPVANACARSGVSLELWLQDDTGRIPLEELGLADLKFLHGVLSQSWRRLTGEARPQSLGADAFEQLRSELRACVRRKGNAALATPAAARAADAGRPLLLPPLDHWVWTDDGMRQEFLPDLLAHTHLPSVQRWLLALVTGRGAATAFRQRPWLRLLLQRLASDHRPSEALDLLRTLYGDARGREALLAEDRALAETLPLSTWGGPWADKLGIARFPKRAPPFKVPKKPRAPAAAAAPPRVTVLIPSFRHELYVAESIQSVLAQKEGGFRLLVVDDASDDQTVARVKEVHDPRLALRVNPSNQGLGNTVLAALAEIDTPLVALLNSDDLFHPDRLTRCLAALDADPAVQLVTTGMSLIDQAGGELRPETASLVLDGKKVFDWVHWFHRVQPREPLAGVALFRALLQHNFLATSSNLVARTDWLRRQEAPLQSLKYCLDWQLFLQAALEGAHHHIAEPLVSYRLHATNTVWFREGRRWSYFLEVNRVAAEALRQFFGRHGRDAARESDVLAVLEAVVAHVANNREADGFALYLNEVLAGLELERAADRNPRIQSLVERLNDVAQHTRMGRDVEDRLGDDPWSALSQLDQLPQVRVHETLGELAQEEAAIERGARRWLSGYVEDLERRLRECWAGREVLERDKAALLEKETLLDGWIRDFSQQVHHLSETRSQLLKGEVAFKSRIGELEAELETTRTARRTAEAELQRVVSLEEATRQALAAERAELQSVRADAQSVRADAQSLRGENAALRDEGTRLRGEVDRLHEAVRQGEREGERVRGERDALEAARARLAEEVVQLRGSREFRSGNFLWNKLPLGYATRRGKKWLRRGKDLKDRAGMALGRMFRRKKAEKKTAIVAACWQFPIYSHTFVYQEMLGLTHMGMDLKLFCWDSGDQGQLHAAFRYLEQHKTQLQPVWENHVRDRDHFQSTCPGRLESFLELVALRVGRSVADLMQDSLVLQGCTFARMAELAGASYLHTYFFYDQSFMAMLAAWLLRIPRGVSCYADHMLQDYPFKLVALHVETADVVVATSKRIQGELSQLTGGRFDQKILVKPNGVDGARFPFVDRGPRQPDQPFEVLSVSRIEPKKGLVHLVDAVAELKRRGQRVIAHVVGTKDPHSKGSVEYAEQFERRLHEAQVADQFVLHGFKKQEELGPILQRCRAFVAPYVEVSSGDKDGIPTAMLEAMASGLPVVTTDSGSILEVVDDGVEGLLCKQGDDLGFADALGRLIADPRMEQKMARAARARFDKEFDSAVTEKRLHARVRALLEQYAKAKSKG